MFVTVIALKYALCVSQWSYGHFLKLRVQFYLNNTIKLRHLTQDIISCYSAIPTKWLSYRDHRLRVVLSPYVLVKHFIGCIGYETSRKRKKLRRNEMVWTHSVSITLCRTWNGRAIGWKKVLFFCFYA